MRFVDCTMGLHGNKYSESHGVLPIDFVSSISRCSEFMIVFPSRFAGVVFLQCARAHSFMAAVSGVPGLRYLSQRV